MLRVLAFVLIMGISVLDASGRDPLDLNLQQALEMALRNNKSYAVNRLQVDRFRQKARGALDFLPTITAEGTWELDEKVMETIVPPIYPGASTQRIAIDFTRTFQMTFKVVQPIFAGGRNWFSHRNARLDVDIAVEQARGVREELVFSVKKVFYNIQVMEALREAHRDAAEAAELNLSDVRRRADLGLASRYDILQAELAADAVKPEQTRVDKLLELSRFQLKTMLGLQEDAEIRLTGALECENFPLPDPEKLLEAALDNHPDLRRLALEKKKNQNLLRAAYGQFLPQISLLAAYTARSDYLNFRPGNWENYYSVNLWAQFPIFLQMKRPAVVGELKVAERMMDLGLDEAKSALKLEIRRLLLTLREERQNIELGIKTIETAREGLRMARITYREGLIPILELTQSLSRASQARVAYLQAVYNYNIAGAELTKLTGSAPTGD